MVGEALKSIVEKTRVLVSNHNKERLPYVITVIVAFIVVVAGINIFVELTAKVKGELLGNFDDRATEYFLSFRSSILTDYFVFVTDVGDVKGYLVIMTVSVALTFLIFKKWKYVGQIFLVLILATLSNMMLKRFIDRARPEIEHLVTVKTLSYPSGHAMSSMAFYGFVIYLVYKLRIKTFWKFILITSLILLIASIGISRIYLGVHFPSDVLGGWIAGMIWIFFCIFVFNLVEVFRRDRKK